MGAAVPPDNTETQSVWSSSKTDGLILRWADETLEKIINDPPLDAERLEHPSTSDYYSVKSDS